jgi:riboflavin kinase/FMN adenylyltransferase
MELVRGLHNLRPRHRGCVVTIGNYDGLHLGHQAMLERVRARAAEFKVPACVMSFEPSPREYLASIGLAPAAPGRLSRFREKVHNLAAFAVDRFVCARFDARMQSVEPRAFIEDILVAGLGVRWVVVGNDFRFAKARAGTVEMLRDMGAKMGFGVDQVPPFLVDGERVSSSLVRAALAAGDMQQAAHLLGRPYRMFGKVIAGKQLGRELGFPTANLRLHRRIVPMMGVFAVRVSGAGLQNAPGVANLGTRPAVDGKEPLLEAHVFDFDGDLYGKNLHVDFVARLRDERWYPNLDELVVQMKADERNARAILISRDSGFETRD